MSELLVSIDLGTTRLKVAAYALDGTLAHLVVRRHEEHELSHPEENRRWQSAEGWWQDTIAAWGELREVLPHQAVLGISLSGRGGAAVFADAGGEVIADPWSDHRHWQQSKRLADWREQGLALSNYGLQLIAKYLWLRDNHPEATADVHRGFYGKDWLLYRLTGEHQTDWSSGPDASGWDPHLDEFDLPPVLLPQPALPWEIAGSLTDQAATALDLPTGTPVAVGAHDGLAANIGAGAIEQGQYAITLGTHAVVRAVQHEPSPGAYRFYGLPPDKHIIGGNAVLAGRSADWFLELVERDLPADDRSSSYARHEAAAAGMAPGAGGVRFLPFLAGQVAPEPRPDARAVFAGLGLGHGHAELYRAVLEGASFAVRSIFDQVVGWCGPPDIVRATGGGAESELWMNILANAIDSPIELTGAAVEGRGAAMCLAVALGIHRDLDAASAAMIRVEQVVRPERARVDAYGKIYEDWSRLNALSRQFDELTTRS